MIPGIQLIGKPRNVEEDPMIISFIEKGRRRCFMPKVIRGRDADVDCDFVARGETEEELFRNTLEHGRKFHGMKEIPKDLQEKTRKLIREEKAA
jgi:predicted small metal-binding protein